MCIGEFFPVLSNRIGVTKELTENILIIWDDEIPTEIHSLSYSLNGISNLFISESINDWI